MREIEPGDRPDTADDADELPHQDAIAGPVDLEPGGQVTAFAAAHRQVPAADDRRASRLLRGERCDTESGDDEGGTNYLRRRRQIGHGPILGSLPNVSSTGPSVTVVSVSWIVNVKLLPRMRPRRESGYAP